MSSGSVINGRGEAFDWSSEVDMYDRHGPGFVGSYLDLVSGRVASAGPRLQDLHGIGVHDKQILAIWRGVWSTFLGPYSSGPELVERMARLRAKKGECYVIELASGKFAVAHPNELDWSRAGFVRWLDPVTEIYEHVSIDDGRVWRSWTMLDMDPRYATSDLERALPHIREYINVKLRQDADVTSPLVRNKLIRFGQDTELYESDDEADPLNGMPDAFVDYINLAKRQDSQRYHHKRRGVDNVPFPVVGDDLEIIDMARTSDPYTSELEEKAVNAFARAVRVPIQYIHAGPGTAKFANEGYIAEALIEDAIIPLGNPIYADLWRIVMKKRMAFAMVGVMAISFEEAWTQLGRMTIVTNDDVIRPSTNKIEDVINGYQSGAATRLDVADALSTTPIDIPPGVSEYEFWQIARTTRQTTAPVKNPVTPEELERAQATIDGPATKELLPGPPDAVTSAPAQAPAPARDTDPVAEALADGEIYEREYPLALPVAAAPTNLTPIQALERDSAVRQMLVTAREAVTHAAAQQIMRTAVRSSASTLPLPPPSAQLLVPTDSPAYWELRRSLEGAGIAQDEVLQLMRRERARALRSVPRPAHRIAAAAAAIAASPAAESRKAIVASANATDSQLAAVLAALANSAADALIDEAAKNLSRIAPAASDLKTRLAAASTSTEKLAVVTENDIIRYGLSPELLLPEDSPALERLMLNAHDAIEREGGAFAAVFAAAVALTPNPAARFQVNAVRGSAVLGAGVLRNVRFRIGSGGRVANADVAAPFAAIRNAMAVAGGAQDGVSAQDLEGFAVSAQTVRHFPMTFEWRHGFYGTPKDAFPEHRALDGITADARGSFNGYFPGDHHNCTCAVLGI